jgi:probable FeS assembly SUF system protein SufT
MYTREEVATSREVEAIQIPDGTRIRLPEGERLFITQNLGGNFTVMTERGAMYRIDQRDADALGKEAAEDLPQGDAPPDAEALEGVVWDQLKKCYDPEIPVNIVDLGLVYDCRVEPTPDEGYRVEIKMTLTAPGCGMGPVLAEDVRNRVEEIPGVREAEVEVVFDPPWNQNMMSEAARLQLGFF